MENIQITSKDKLEFLGIIKESWNITSQNPTFIFLSFLVTLPSFLLSLCHQLVLQQLFHESADFITQYERTFTPLYTLDYAITLIQRFSPTIILLSLSHLTIGHLLNLINTIFVVHSASTIYAGKKGTGNNSIKEVLLTPFSQVGLVGPYVTSLCILALVVLVKVGLASVGFQLIAFAITGWVSKVLFGSIFVALLAKYVEWSAIWNVGLVVSILEGKHGYIGIGVSGCISRGCRKRGFLLMLVFLVWKIIVRIGFGHYGFLLLMRSSGSIGMSFCAIAVGESGLVWFGEVMNWVVCTVYYYDSRSRFLEKKVDSEKAAAL